MSTEEKLSESGIRDREGLNGDDQLRQRKGKLINCAKDTISNGGYIFPQFNCLVRKRPSDVYITAIYV